MLAACDLYTLRGTRDAAIINALIDTGLRAAEICAIDVDRLCTEQRQLIVKVKGGQECRVWFGETTAAALNEWLAIRPAAPGQVALFVAVGGSTPGGRLTTRGLRSIVRSVGRQAGHAFRRGFACIATQAGAPTRTVQLAGRRADIRMVEDYTRTLRGEGLYDQWSPADQVKGREVGP